MEVLRRCPLAIAQRLVHCAIALSTAVLDRVTKTMSVAPLLMNNLDNSKQKTSNLLSPAPPPYSWSLLGKSEGPAPPPSSKISWSFDLAWNPAASQIHRLFCRHYESQEWHINAPLNHFALSSGSRLSTNNQFRSLFNLYIIFWVKKEATTNTNLVIFLFLGVRKNPFIFSVQRLHPPARPAHISRWAQIYVPCLQLKSFALCEHTWVRASSVVTVNYKGSQP